MTRIVFYVGVAEHSRFLRRFLHSKVFIPRKTAFIYAAETALDDLDRALWDGEFLPHQRLGEGEGADMPAPIMLSSVAPAPEFHCDIMVSCVAEVPTALIGRFPVCVDIVGADEASKKAGRLRYRYFQDHGYSVEVVNIGKKPGRTT